jgi:hypothetical protein
MKISDTLIIVHSLCTSRNQSSQINQIECSIGADVHESFSFCSDSSIRDDVECCNCHCNALFDGMLVK